MSQISKEFLQKVGEEILNHSELTKTIKNRGKSLFRKGAIINVEINNSSIEALVVGTHPYLVRVELEGNRIRELSCSCPYDGYICKHIAALGFYLSTVPLKEKFKFYFVPQEVAERALIQPIVYSNPLYKVLKEILENLYTSNKVHQSIFEKWIYKLFEPYNDEGFYLLLVMLSRLDYSKINRENWNQFVEALFRDFYRISLIENTFLIDEIVKIILKKSGPLLKEELKKKLENLEEEYWDW